VAARQEPLDDSPASLSGGTDDENGGLLHEFIAPFFWGVSGDCQFSRVCKTGLLTGF
jgi:hypothetical protein